MNQETTPRFDKNALRLSLLYCILAIAWVLVSNGLMEAGKDHYFAEKWDLIQVVVDVVFIIFSSVVIYFILNRYNNRIHQSKLLEKKAFVESTRYYQAILENSFEGIVLVSRDGQLLYQTPSAEKILGYTHDEKRNAGVFSVLPKEDQENALHAFVEMASIPGKQIFAVTRVIHKDGNERVLEIFAKNLLDDPVVKGIVVNYRDVTEKIKAEEKILNSMIEGEDRERKRIASELHDGLGQQLTAAAFAFEGMMETVHALGNDKQQQFHLGVNFLNKAILESRNIAHNLMPMSMEDFGLVFSLESLFSLVRKTTGLDIVFLHNIGKDRFPLLIETNLYRISQEAINNVIKHANARQVTVQLVKHPQYLCYTFEDDGAGFNYSIKTSGIGLLNIANRVKAMSGELNIDSKPGNGTAISIEMPV